MENQEKIDKIFESVNSTELLSWVKVHAYVDDKFALALLDRFWKPEHDDEKSVVEQCFMHPSCLKDLKYNWTAIEQDLTKLMPSLEKMYEDGELVRAAYLAGNIMTITCKAYREDFYSQYEKRIKPVMECVRRAEEIVRDILIVGESLEDESRVGILSEITEGFESVTESPVFHVDRFLEEAYLITMPMKEYISFINKLLRRKRDFFHYFHVINKAKCLLKNGLWDKTKIFLDKEVDSDENVRVFYVDLLIEKGELRKALEVTDTKLTGFYKQDWIGKQLEIMDLINDKKLSIDFCRNRFLNHDNYYRLRYYKKMKESVPVSQWDVFLDKLLQECDFYCDVDKTEVTIYIEEGMHDKIFPYIERGGGHSIVENLKKYGKYLDEEQQTVLAKRFSDWVINRTQSDILKIRKGSDAVASWIFELANVPEVGIREAKILLDTLNELHRGRFRFVNLNN